jgi:lyso-ornithine lipid O-acyltransferase
MMYQAPRHPSRSEAPPGAAAGVWLAHCGDRLGRGGLRAARRLVGLVLLTLGSMGVQSALLMLPGRAKVWFARAYWAGFCRMLGMRVRVIGAPVATAGRPVLFVSNHSSWVDIPVLGGMLPACFVAKGEVARWPMIGTVARLGRTVFISRRRGSMAREIEAMRGVMARGDNLILFPEGTTSDGSRVMDFRASFFALAGGAEPPIVQPVSVVYDRLAGLPAGRATWAVFAWYGDMDIASHYWGLARHQGLRVTVILHRPIDPREQPDRKALCREVWKVVADGAATLRQNRPAQPIDARAATPGTIADDARVARA